MMPSMDGCRFAVHRPATRGSRLATIPTVIVTGSPLPTVIDAGRQRTTGRARRPLLSFVRHHCLRRHSATAAARDVASRVRCASCHPPAGVAQRDGRRSVRCLACYRDALHGTPTVEVFEHLILVCCRAVNATNPVPGFRCPDCAGSQTIRTNQTELSEIHFCFHCGKTFIAKRPDPKVPSR
jgi:hypothetical protein